MTLLIYIWIYIWLAQFVSIWQLLGGCRTKSLTFAGNKIDARPLAIASWIFCGRVLPIYHSPTLASSSFVVLKSFKVNFIKKSEVFREFFNKIQRIIIAHFVYVYVVYCASPCASNLHTFPAVSSVSWCIFSVWFIDLRSFFCCTDKIDDVTIRQFLIFWPIFTN